MELIVGPCSLESEEMAEELVKFLTRLGIKYVRGGSAKYRSNPNDYQGTYAAYRWMADLKKKYSFQWVNEIFDHQFAASMKNVVDMYQIGSRNMHNTNLLTCLKDKHLGKPILFKRHYSASLNEFLNHAAYLDGEEVILCLRGVMGLWPQEQRFHPDVTDIPRLRNLIVDKNKGKHVVIAELNNGVLVAKEDSRVVTDYKICYDVSHSACDKIYVKNLIKCAMIYQPDYLMIEVHPEPSKALSDPAQQITMETFERWYKEGLFDTKTQEENKC